MIVYNISGNKTRSNIGKIPKNIKFVISQSKLVKNELMDVFVGISFPVIILE